MKLRLAIEGFQTPNHLPLIAGIEQGEFAEAGLDIEIVPPDPGHDELARVATGEIELACATPLHMLDAPRPQLRALGCFLETEGGILILHSAMEALAAGGRIRLAVPARGLAARVAIEMLRRWFDAHHPSIGLDQIDVRTAGPNHIENLYAGFDAAWPCFANVEGVEAVQRQVDGRFLSTHEVGLANAAGLELFTSAEFLTRHPEIVDRVRDVISRSAQMCSEHPVMARELWYRHVGAAPDAVTDAILDDTGSRFVTPLVRERSRWYGLWKQLDDLGRGELTEQEFEELYA